LPIFQSCVVHFAVFIYTTVKALIVTNIVC